MRFSVTIYSHILDLYDLTDGKHLHTLQHLHTFGLRAQCANVYTASSVEQLQEITQFLAHKPYLVLGEGSNTVFVQDYPYSIVRNTIRGVVHTEDEQNHYLSVGAGENWHALVIYCMQKGIGGFENLALIPGTVGAAPIQNIGAYGVEINRFISSVDFINTQTNTLQSIQGKDCKFAYRDSLFKRQTLNSRIITHVHFRLPKQYELVLNYGPLHALGDCKAIDVFNAVIKVREEKLPSVKQFGNAGSFFKNPVISFAHFQSLSEQYQDMPSYIVSETERKVPAAWLIDHLGFKGKVLGDISCHSKQPLVLVNLGDGKGQDLLQLARNIKSRVYEVFGIELENEVRLIGKQGLIIL